MTHHIQNLKISVIIPYGSGRSSIWKCVRSLNAQTLSSSKFEIIVIDDGANLTVESIKKLKAFGACILQKPRTGVGDTRNLGITSSQGDLIVMLDDDCVADGELLAAYQSFFSNNSDVDFAGGTVQSIEQSGLVAAYASYRGLLSKPIMANDKIISIITANCCARRQVLINAGGFETCLDTCLGHPGGDDADLSFRLRMAGYKLGFCPSAIVAHYHRSNLSSFIEQQARVGAGLAVHSLLRKIPLSQNGLPEPTILACTIHFLRFFWSSHPISGSSLIKRIVTYSRDKHLSLFYRVSFPVIDVVRRCSYIVGILRGSKRFIIWKQQHTHASPE